MTLRSKLNCQGARSGRFTQVKDQGLLPRGVCPCWPSTRSIQSDFVNLMRCILLPCSLSIIRRCANREAVLPYVNWASSPSGSPHPVGLKFGSIYELNTTQLPQCLRYLTAQTPRSANYSMSSCLVSLFTQIAKQFGSEIQDGFICEPPGDILASLYCLLR